MFKVIKSPDMCEIRSDIRFLTARNMSAADIHRQIMEAYGTEVMSESKVRKWREEVCHFIRILIRYEEEKDDMLSRIVTGDKTWVSHITPKSKQQSMEWRHTFSPVKVKAKQTLSKRKIMATVFWDRRGVFLVDFMPQGTTINSGAYCVTLLKLRRALQNKWCNMLSKGVLLHHDNARPHTSRTTRKLIESFGWKVLNHAPYSPQPCSL
ncbi:mariner Mos1 transposase [Trichonephila clavipes]|nr:mariner Mos1 transposase [Trichonephila clavipes]